MEKGSTNNTKENLHQGNGLVFEASEEIFFKDEVSLTRAVQPKPIVGEKIEPAFHYTITMRSTHFDKSAKKKKNTPYGWFLKTSSSSNLLSLFGGCKSMCKPLMFSDERRIKKKREVT